MLTNEELYDLERAKDRLANVAMKIKDESDRDKVLKVVYELGSIIDAAEADAKPEIDFPRPGA